MATEKDFLEILKFSSSMGDVSTALGNAMYGVNHNNEAIALKSHRNRGGYTFFTRPQLCLTSTNLAYSRMFIHLLDKEQNSVLSFVRRTLDPRLMGSKEIVFGNVDSTVGAVYKAQPLGAKNGPIFLDNDNIFIPLLSNSIKSISGFPDPALPTYASSENIRGGQWIIGDGHLDIFRSYDVSVTFEDYYGIPIILLFNYWINYIAEVFSNTGMQPYPDMIAYNEIDYNTRIYRLIMDETNRYVRMIYACGAAFPSSIDMGRMFNYNRDNVYGEDVADVNITFKCVGANYNDPILIDEFNKTVCIGNPKLKEARINLLLGKSNDEIVVNNYVKIPFAFKQYFNFRGYPLINPNTMELEWYISTTSTTYKHVANLLKSTPKYQQTRPDRLKKEAKRKEAFVSKTTSNVDVMTKSDYEGTENKTYKREDLT